MRASLSDFLATAAEAVGNRKAVRYGSVGGQVALAVADGTRKRPAGFTCYAAALGETVSVQRTDILDGFSGLTPGVVYYLSQSNPGEITSARPSSGEVQVAGVSRSSDSLDVGFHCEEGTYNELVMKDQVTGDLYKVSVVNGALTVTPV